MRSIAPVAVGKKKKAMSKLIVIAGSSNSQASLSGFYEYFVAGHPSLINWHDNPRGGLPNDCRIGSPKPSSPDGRIRGCGDP
jgi:hypothetical protein